MPVPRILQLTPRQAVAHGKFQTIRHPEQFPLLNNPVWPRTVGFLSWVGKPASHRLEARESASTLGLQRPRRGVPTRASCSGGQAFPRRAQRRFLREDLRLRSLPDFHESGPSPAQHPKPCHHNNLQVAAEPRSDIPERVLAHTYGDTDDGPRKAVCA